MKHPLLPDLGKFHQTHMPFYSPHGDGGIWLFCARDNSYDTWRLATTIGGEPEYLDVRLPIEWNICGPCASWDDGEWDISFIAGQPGGPYHLYSHDGIQGHEARLASSDVADAGFARNQWQATATRHGPVRIRHGNTVRTISIPNLRYIYRIAYNPTNPHSLWITADIDHSILLLVIDGKQPDNALVVTSPSSELYKGVPIGLGAVAYARRRNGAGYEVRDIRITEPHEVEYSPLDGVVWMDENDADSLSCIECFRKHLASAIGYCKEIHSGHGEGSHLDHRLDLAAEISQMENHARELGIDGYRKALKDLRYNMEKNKWIPSDEDTDLLRRLWDSSLGVTCGTCGHR